MEILGLLEIRPPILEVLEVLLEIRPPNETCVYSTLMLKVELGYTECTPWFACIAFGSVTLVKRVSRQWTGFSLR